MRFGPQQTPPLEHQKTHLFLERAFTPDECERLVAQAQAIPEEIGQLIGGEAVYGIRRCHVRWLPEDDVFGWVQDRMTSLVAAANRETFGLDLWGMDERLQFLEYEAGERSFFDWHADRGRSGFAKTRKLSVSVQLSNPADYDGGVLEINLDGTPLTAPRGQGTAIVFISTILHRVAPVTSGRRAALTAWFHGPHFR